MAESPTQRNPSRARATAGDLRVLVGRLRGLLRAQSHIGELTWPQIDVLTWLEREGPATVTALARAQGVRPQSMGETLQALKAAGQVSGAPDPADGRQTLLSLTQTFRTQLKASREAKEDWLFRAISKKFTAAEQEQLAAAVTLLKRLVED